ncbi:lytic transglycosylase domain-containing protein [Chondromyces crocatus]|uniref:Murein transglycosylase n=1 Tax=Chondromyces crocatus TaxID=52 RepID=A0A0K1EGF9_CHOCO|nr:lytic transglycosylase domain-containing protein [Chondromyces crocatus]AKT39767.1 murein transglycosylase [Chondromyces crocatus]
MKPGTTAPRPRAAEPRAAEPRAAAPRAAGGRARLTRAATVLGALAFCVSLCPGRAEADIYMYTDADGVTHFSNRAGADPKFKLYLKSQERRGTSRNGITPTLPSDRSLDRFTRYDAWIRQAGTLYQIPEELIRAVIKVESDYDPRAVSPAGAQGLMQLMPPTALRMQVRDAFDPREAIFGGTRYLRVLANVFNGDLDLTIAGYNAGEGAVLRYNGIPPYQETQTYVTRVRTYYARYRANRDATAASTEP